jgi:uncharacterized protein YjiS (DUF1127 family)
MFILAEQMISSFFKTFDKMRHQRKAEYELFSLTDRELQDLGINRCDIYRIVYEATEERY